MLDIVMRPSVLLASHAIQATLGSGEGIDRGRRRRRLLRHRVAADGEARARLRSVLRAHSDNHLAARYDGPPQRRDAALPIRSGDEEVEDGAVVPDVVAPIGLPLVPSASTSPSDTSGTAWYQLAPSTP
jgi:hypothetical protein